MTNEDGVNEVDVNEVEVKELIAKRGILKSKITKFTSFLKGIDPNNASQLTNLKLRLSKIECLYPEFDQIQTQLELLEPQQADQRDTVENSYFEAVTEATEIIKHQSARVDSDSNGTNQNSSSNSSNSFSFNLNDSKLKLPPIPLPSFDGNQEQWLSFYETFISMIHDETKLNNLQRLHYLKSCLKGDAANIIKELATTADNYEIALEILVQRYENKRLIIKNHISALFDLPVVIKESAQALRNLIDSVNLHMKVLKRQALPTEQWDILLIYLMLSKLDYTTKRSWEEANNDDLPKFSDFLDFLNKKYKTLTALEYDKKLKTVNSMQVNNNKTDSHKFSSSRTASHVTVDYKPKCDFCSNSHYNNQCDDFHKLSVNDRLERVTALKLCTNCLKANHLAHQCRSSTRCKTCHKRHNSLLHSYFDEQQSVANSEGLATSSSNLCKRIENSNEVILSTAIIQVPDHKGAFHEIRALLDQGSQANFITTATCKKLNIKLNPTSYSIVGINQGATQVQYTTTIKIQSCYNNYNKVVSCLVLPKITSDLPLNVVSAASVKIPKNIKLADPNFNITGSIDMLLGAEIFWELLSVGQIKTGKTQPYFQKTELGWIIGGAVNHRPHNNKRSVSANLVTNKELEARISKFWEIEQCNETMDFKLSPEEAQCEAHFVKNYKRNSDGRFAVSLPFKDNVNLLGKSRGMALKRFYNLERRLSQNPELKRNYQSFIEEYLELGHMEAVPANEYNNNCEQGVYYLPHHPVLKEASLTTKLRVVFDASAKTSSGLSLNSTLRVGPTIQSDLFTILLRFRIHKYVLTADISKMYRQVLIEDSERDFQRILWRSNPDEQIQTFRLKTVTYGMAPSAFLAIRSLYQLALESKNEFPLAAKCIMYDFYVDDLLTGTNDLAEARRLRVDLSNILKTGGFELRQWASNEPSLLADLNISENPTIVSLDKQGETKALGVIWNCNQDKLKYYIKPIDTPRRVTKRIILSVISQLFDPLGLIAPIIITAKILLQHLWILNLTWDETVPDDIYSKWNHFLLQLPGIQNLKIPRHVVCNDAIHYEIHAFSDASESAFGSCVYLKSVGAEGNSEVCLIAAKSRVAPLKTLTIPRLELCAAALSVKLVHKTSSLGINIASVSYWSDSTIVLSWIKESPNNWKTFVANRVAQIQSYSQTDQWHYINTKHNPADLVSRGTTADKLLNSKLWWEGPKILNCSQEELKVSPWNIAEAPERRNPRVLTVIQVQNDTLQLFETFSNFCKLQRVVAYCFRFVDNCRLKSNKKQGTLTCQELNKAKIFIFKIIQRAHFPEEIKNIAAHKRINSRSKILALNPFICKDGLLRVGGRLSHCSSISYEQKHPIIIPAKEHITKILIRNEHIRLLHAGPLATLSSLRQKYWPISGRGLVKKLIHNCVKCSRAAPKSCTELMGDLPKTRVEPARPFINCGVDFCGPFLIRDGRSRGKRAVKAYVSVFVCFVTRAIHLELVSDLTTDSFLNAFKRFISRRGHVANIYSDNATNFIGSRNELGHLRKLFVSQEFKNKCMTDLAQCNINWHFIPPKSPNFGGLWEAAVKSCKYHLKRVVGDSKLTYEELYTMLTRIEACLNSRPLIPLSSDPDDLSVITPAHFLIGDSLTSFVEPDLCHLKINTLSRWQLIERLRQNFWKQWTKEYLHQLQQRSKWKTKASHSLQLNDLVIIKEDHLPPLKWSLGRIIELHPGSDGLVRAVSAKTSAGVVKRSVAKICSLPVES